MQLTIWLVLILAIIGAVVWLIYKMNKTGGTLVQTLKDMTSDVVVKTPAKLADFLAEPANQEGGYTPWVKSSD
jgi:hypothetical protein